MVLLLLVPMAYAMLLVVSLVWTVGLSIAW